MDHKLTQNIQAWLDTPEKERDYALGAVFFLQLSNNKIMYHNMTANLKKSAPIIEYQIRKYMKFRLAQLTHREVEQMQQQVNLIAITHSLDSKEESTGESTTPKAADSAASGDATPSASPTHNNTASARTGKRPDHDTLPDEIKALYVENLTLLHEMRELHMKLRSLSVENATCPDSERYPFLKELIAKDKQYHKNWETYDRYVADTTDEVPATNDSTEPIDESSSAEPVDTPSEEPEGNDAASFREADLKFSRQLNIAKGKYKKNPTDELKEKIVALYAQLHDPKPTLTAELMDMGIL